MLNPKEYSIRQSFHAPDAKLLIVDDNLVNLKIVTGLLARTKVKIKMAISGKECLELIKDESYHMVLLDHMMPQMDGIETLHRIRKMKGEYFKTLPVIALTANFVSGAKEMFKEEGFSECVFKPIDIQKLEKAILKYLPEYLVDEIEDNILHGLDKSIIDIQNGISMFGEDKTSYIEILQLVLKDGRKKIPLIQQYLDNKDFINVRIEVHALKSVAANIGANELSLQSKKMEDAAKDNDILYLNENMQSLLINYQKLLDNIEAAFEKKNSAVLKNNKILPILSNEEFQKMIINLRQFIDEFEQDEAIELLDKILQHEIKDVIWKERLNSIKECLQEFEFEQAFKLSDI